MTKGEVLRYAIAFALRCSRKIVRGLKEALTEEERYAVADHAVAQLKERERLRQQIRHQHSELRIRQYDATEKPCGLRRFAAEEHVEH